MEAQLNTGERREHDRPSPELMEHIENFGGPTRIRTWNQKLNRQQPEINGFIDFRTVRLCGLRQLWSPLLPNLLPSGAFRQSVQFHPRAAPRLFLAGAAGDGIVPSDPCRQLAYSPRLPTEPFFYRHRTPLL